jgi:hypothetical protein
MRAIGRLAHWTAMFTAELTAATASTLACRIVGHQAPYLTQWTTTGTTYRCRRCWASIDA